MRGLLKLLALGSVLYSGYLWAHGGTVAVLNEFTARVRGKVSYQRISVAGISLEVPIELRPTTPPTPAQNDVLAANEMFMGKAAGCVVVVHHVRLAQGRDAFALSREVAVKTHQLPDLFKNWSIVARKGPTPLMVAGARAEWLQFELQQRNLHLTANRLTIPRNRDVWMIAVFSEEWATRQSVFSHVVNSVRL
jgi:hypothetical protein